MSDERNLVPNPKRLGSLTGCLVEGDLEQRSRERRGRHRSLAVSILLQGSALAALILIPLFGRTERLALGRVYIPIPPYRPAASMPRPADAPTNRDPRVSALPCFICPVRSHPADRPLQSTAPGELPPDFNGAASVQLPDYIDGATSTGPKKPDSGTETARKKVVYRATHLDPAMLIHRVEPAYPAIPRQLGREGRVELRAIIATDGSIQSLEIVSGDPLFFQSAREAVSQWRYKPLILNGQPVEIDTVITVVYTMRR